MEGGGGGDSNRMMTGTCHSTILRKDPINRFLETVILQTATHCSLEQQAQLPEKRMTVFDGNDCECWLNAK